MGILYLPRRLNRNVNMSQAAPLFELSDFARYRWTEILEQIHPKECENYSEALRAKAREYQLQGDDLAQELFTFLSKITSIFIAPLGSKKNSALEKMISETLSDYDLTILRELVTTVSAPEIKARIADLLWICKRDLEKARPSLMAKVAVESYLQSARILEDVEGWTSCCDRIERAAQLALLIDGKKNTKMRCLVVQYIDNLITRYVDVENEFLTGSAMKVLQANFQKHLNVILDNVSSSATKYAGIAAQKAIYAEKLEEFPSYHQAYYQKVAYREIESKWYKIAGEREAERNAKWHLAEAEVWYAQQAFVGNESSSYAVAAGRIKSAIKGFKKIEDTFGKRQDTSERIEELHKQMLDYQQKSMSQMISIPFDSNDFDDPQMQQTARDLVTGKSLRDALYSLAFGCELITSFDVLKTQAKQDKESNSLSNLFPTALVDREGKTKAISNNDDNNLEDSMFKIANLYQEWYGLNFIFPACQQICSEHNVNINDLAFIFEENPFIPQEREYFYAKGLLAGLKGDLVIAAHLLIPQLENSLRHILKQHGFIASNLTSKMIQDEFTLNKVLELPDLKPILAEDIIFTLRGLLVERMGLNIRNEICHGLFNHSQFFMPQIVYFWWLTLYLCLVPSYKQWAAENKE
jgi:Domain of unknown function (DUF4209)